MNLGFFKKALPWLASAIPGGGVVSKIAFEAIGKALGVDPPKDAGAAEAVLAKATPEQLQALKAEDHAFSIRMKELGIQEVADIERIAAADRDSARQREIKTGDSWTPRLIAFTFILGWFSIQWWMVTHIVPTEMREIIMRTLGTLDMVLGLIVGYYFGSSAGSDKKNALIEKLSAD